MKLRDMPREMAWLLGASIIVNLASNMYFPFLPLYLETLGASVEQVGFFYTAVTLLSLVFRVLGGWISDTMGRVETMALGGIVGFIAVIFFALAPTWGWAMVGALFSQIGMALVAPSFQAYTAENAPEGSTSSTFGLVNGLYLICEVVGRPLGAALIAGSGYKMMLWAAAVIFGVGAIIRLQMARGRSFRVGSLKVDKLRNEIGGMIALLLGGGLLLWLFLIDGLFDNGLQVVMPFLPKYVTEIGGLNEQAYANLLSGMSVVAALAMVPAGIFADRFRERWAIAVGFAVIGITWIAITAFPTEWGFIVAFGLAGIGQAFIGPAFSSLMSKAVPKESLGITFGIFMTALGALAIPAPYIGGVLYDRVGPFTPMIVAAGLCALAIPLALWKLRLPAEVDHGTPSVRDTAEALIADISASDSGVIHRPQVMPVVTDVPEE